MYKTFIFNKINDIYLKAIQLTNDENSVPFDKAVKNLHASASARTTVVMKENLQR